MRVETLGRTVARKGMATLAKMALLTAGVFAAWFSAAALAADASPVFRFYNNRTGTHFYTISGAERDSVLNNYPWFSYEGAVYWAYTGQEAGTSPVYRFYNSRTGTHFYTQSESEKNYVIATYPVFAFEGPVYYAPQSGSMTGSTALYRFYNTKTGAHFYTTSEGERDHVLATWPWFAYESVAYFVFTGPTQGPGPGPGNAAPKATLAASASTVMVPGSVMLTASVSDSDGTIAKVQFYSGTLLLAEVTSAPYTLSQTFNTTGTFSYTAIAVDDKGAAGASNAVQVTATSTGVNPPGNVAPKITLATSATTFAAPGSATLTATASDSDGTVTSVKFYNGATVVANLTAAPYTYTFSAAGAATATFTAVAQDNAGATTMSNALVITATGVNPPGNSPPKITLAASATTITAPGSAMLTATASDSDGTVTSVKFYNGASLVSTLSAAPYTYTYAAAAAGTSTFTAVAQDNVGATTVSNPIAITANGAPGGAPVPKMTFSVSNTLVAAPGTVTLSATNVSSTGLTIARVSFFMNGVKLIDKFAAPYTFTANVPASASYMFTAEAQDSAGTTHMTLPIKVQGTGTPASGPVSADVWRLLQQATFGPSYADAQAVQSLGISGWIDNQFTLPVVGYPDTKYNKIQLRTTPDCNTNDPNNVAYPADHPYAMCVRDHLSLAMLQRDFFTNAVYAPDQLRQRVAWALSQIIVTSGNEPDLSYAYVMSRFQNLMFNNAFGNYETLLNQVTLNPAMGNYLDAVNNDRASGTKVPNENYAREIQQLFSVGINELNGDGSEILDVSGMPVPTYDQNDIKEFAKVFTGLTFADPANLAATTATKKNNVYYAANMIPYPVTATTGHEQSAKTLLATVLPAGQTIQKDLTDAVHDVFMHPNTPVYLGRQLIQRLVTGNPSPAYITRIANVFKNNGAGVRGDLKAVVKAILMDPEARGGGAASDPTYGTLKEPVLMITNLIRSLSGITDGSRLEGSASGLGQRPYYSPTVFNYFPPDQTIQGTTILGPEFLIHTTQSAISRSNLVYNLITNPFAPDNTIDSATGTRLNTMQFESLAANPAALVDQVDLVMTAGQTPAAAKATIVTAVNAVPATDPPGRSRMAVFLLGSSYYYQVAR